VTDRERRELRGPVKTVVAETFEWDKNAGAVAEKPSRREELLFSPQGRLLASFSQFENQPVHRATYAYDEAGRLRETTWRNPDGTESRSKLEYNELGEIVQDGAKVTFSSEKGRKVKTEVFESRTPGMNRGFSFGDGPSQTSWTVGQAAVALTAYDEKGRPTEIVVYDEEHVKISKLVRTYDERGRVAVEEQQILSSRVFNDWGTDGPLLSKEDQQLMGRVLSQAANPTRMTFKYDDQDRVIERTHETGLFGYEKTVSFHNEHGDVSKQQTYSTHRGDIPVDEQGNILAPPPAPEKLTSQTDFSYEYDNRGNWTRKKTSTLHDPGSRWESMEKRTITYY
jgi:YD repeat-containing protein